MSKRLPQLVGARRCASLGGLLEYEQSIAATRGGRRTRAIHWIFSVIALNAGACAPTVMVGDLGGGVAGAPSGGASQVETGGDAAGGGRLDGAVGGLGTMLGAAGGPGAMFGAAGAPMPVCAAALDEHLTPVQTACPAALQNTGSPCNDQAENSICVWQINPSSNNAIGYRALGCYNGLKGKIWSGLDVWVDGEVASGDDAKLRAGDAKCPRQAPTLGAACPNGMDTESCIYPTAYCECGFILPDQWLCDQGMGGKVSPAGPVQRLCTPTSFDETQLVKDMGPTLTALWCQWRAQIKGAKDVPVSGKDSPGVADSYPSRQFVTPEMSLCLADLPPELCAQNLDNVGSKCTATIGELDDCLETIYADPPGWVGHGCAPLIRNATCAGVLVQPFTISSKAAQCVVPLK